EIGHKLGLDDSYSEKDRDSIMYGYLTVGERRLPAFGQARFAQTSAREAMHFLSLGSDQGSSPRVSTGSVSLNEEIGALPDGRANAPSSDLRPEARGSSPRVSKGSEPQSGAMFIAPASKHDPELRRSEMLPSMRTNMTLLRSAGDNLGRWFYKHSVPTGLKDQKSEVT